LHLSKKGREQHRNGTAKLNKAPEPKFPFKLREKAVGNILV
jgi:hypothetical protein